MKNFLETSARFEKSQGARVGKKDFRNKDHVQRNGILNFTILLCQILCLVFACITPFFSYINHMRELITISCLKEEQTKFKYTGHYDH